MGKKIILVLLSPFLIVTFIIGLIVYYIFRKTMILEFVFDITEKYTL